MAEGVDDGFPQCRDGNFGDIDPAHAIQSHADVDVLQDELLGLIDQFQQRAVEVVAVENGCAGLGGEHGTAQFDGFIGKEQPGGVDGMAVAQQAQFVQRVGGIVPGKTCRLHELANARLVQRTQGLIDGFVVPAHGCTILAQDQGFQLTGAHLPVFIGNAHVGTPMGIVRPVLPASPDAQAAFAVHFLPGDFRIDARVYAGSNGL